MARRRSNLGDRSLRRRVATRRPRKTLLVFCEGERTEPDGIQLAISNPCSEVWLLAAVRPSASVPTFRGPADFSERANDLLAGFGED